MLQVYSQNPWVHLLRGHLCKKCLWDLEDTWGSDLTMWFPWIKTLFQGRFWLHHPKHDLAKVFQVAQKWSHLAGHPNLDLRRMLAHPCSYDSSHPHQCGSENMKHNGESVSSDYWCHWLSRVRKLPANVKVLMPHPVNYLEWAFQASRLSLNDAVCKSHELHASHWHP